MTQYTRVKNVLSINNIRSMVMFTDQGMEYRGSMLSDESLDPTEAISALSPGERACPLCGHASIEGDPLQIVMFKQERRRLLSLLGIDPDGEEQDIQLELLRCMAKKLS
jgi:hypothetical protein